MNTTTAARPASEQRQLLVPISRRQLPATQVLLDARAVWHWRDRQRSSAYRDDAIRGIVNSRKIWAGRHHRW